MAGDGSQRIMILRLAGNDRKNNFLFQTIILSLVPLIDRLVSFQLAFLSRSTKRCEVVFCGRCWNTSIYQSSITFNAFLKLTIKIVWDYLYFKLFMLVT